MDFLYSLYDALVSINVPNDKARAVVDAMERDMATTLATKQDLLVTGKDLQAVSKDVQAVRIELKQDVAALRTELQAVKAELKQDVAALRTELQAVKAELKQEVAALRTELKQDLARGFAEQQLTLTLRLGSMLAIWTGLLFAGLKLV